MDSAIPTLPEEYPVKSEAKYNYNSDNNDKEATASNSNDSIATLSICDITSKKEYVDNQSNNTTNNVLNEHKGNVSNDIPNNALPNTMSDAANGEATYTVEAQSVESMLCNVPNNAVNTTANSIVDDNNMIDRDDSANGEKKIETTNPAQVLGYGPNRGTAQTTNDVRFDPLRADSTAMTSLTVLQSAATKQALANAKQQALLAHKLKQMNAYTWPGGVTAEQSPYGVMYPMWPLDSTDYAAYGQAFANPQQTAMAMNPGLMGLNPLVNHLVNPLMNPFNTLQNAFTAGIPDGKQHALFVFHLPEDIDDHGLLQLFGPYGAIRANVMRQEDGRTKGFGFVHFNNRHDASIAIEMMNGHQIGRKRLMVSFKKNKDESHTNGAQTQQKPHIPQ
ncbi:hypothetical protein RFI_31169 [Reticulomyxa filosa]|uniref:RRM domain-containing protein n=1 Tax=Reticulomyxa filosa TaxID=46433 RepID=X6LZQ9_RETFI|nr:hypothetical protein RFI_31169 [Reticulomyxa filosa]|eukprot:ETO06230.1 hypothetical protein RFI_31169 [Reticulomyxa filosa]